ncbi:MAG: (2Fe-2S)-binding protein [Synergistaceae bacterium]|nr:(2Fe-2S)-binding protein [Synergistaceae bacterium]
MRGIFKVNANEIEMTFPPEAVLVDVLRVHGYPEVHRGCDEGTCGACSVLLNGELVPSCQVLAASAIGSEITTITALGTPNKPHPIQKAFADAGAIQCGYCTPAMVLAAYALLKNNADPTEDDIRTALDGNICRCSGYVKIMEAVKLASNYWRDRA